MDASGHVQQKSRIQAYSNLDASGFGCSDRVILHGEVG